MNNDFVMAIGDSGLPEPTPMEEVVEIGSLPVGPGNCVIPASIRATRRTNSDKIPLRLISILRPRTRLNRKPFPLVTFKCTPYERYQTDKGPVMGDIGKCFVCNERDARDPLFDSLTVRERFRILSAAHQFREFSHEH
jgi:hypothetical protein